jgi:hypothetical protein
MPTGFAVFTIQLDVRMRSEQLVQPGGARPVVLGFRGR